MSYFPCDIPYMSEEELIENGIKIHRTQIICNKCKHYQGVHNVQGHAPCDYWKSGSVQWNEHCSHAELYKGADVRMTVKELKEKLAEMPDEAKVIVVDSLLCENQIIAIKHDEKYIDADLISRKKANRIDELQTALTTAIRINEFLMAENELLKDKDFTSCIEKLPEEDGCYLVYAPNYFGGSSSAKEIHDGVMFSNYKNGKWSIEVGYHKRPGCVEAWMPIPKYKDRR